MIGFFVFMLTCSLLIPAVMLFFGYRWKEKPPKEINVAFGYRTRRSMSGKKAWNYAHQYFGKLWIKLGWFTLAVTVLIMIALALTTMEIAVVGTVGGILVFLQMIPLIVPIFATERALKQEFGI